MTDYYCLARDDQFSDHLMVCQRSLMCESIQQTPLLCYHTPDSLFWLYIVILQIWAVPFKRQVDLNSLLCSCNCWTFDACLWRGHGWGGARRCRAPPPLRLTPFNLQEGKTRARWWREKVKSARGERWPLEMNCDGSGSLRRGEEPLWSTLLWRTHLSLAGKICLYNWILRIFIQF